MKKGIIEKIDESLYEFYLDADKDIIQEALKDEIQDMNAYNESKQKLLKRISFLSKAIANKQRDEHLLALVSKFQEAIEKNIEQPIAILKQLMSGQLAYYRNLEKLTKEDIMEIIKDKNLVELLEQLDNGNNKQA